MKRVFLTGLVAVATLTACAGEPSLKEVYKNDFLIGTALRSVEKPGAPNHVYPVAQDPRELEVIAREFDCVTPENLMKPNFMRPAPGEFNFEQADEFVTLAETLGVDVVGHVLVWHSQTPKWFFEDADGDPLSREALIERMRNHIHTIVGRYKGRIKIWDVVNEAVASRGEGKEAYFRESAWLKIIGPDFIELAFQFAHEADPDAVLLYNDYGMTHKAKVDFVAENIVKRLKKKGIPIHVVGLQGHWHLEYPRMEEIQYAIDTLVAAGVKVSVTELDIGVLPLANGYQGADVNKRMDLQAELNPYTEGVPDEVLEKQAQKYQQVFALLRKNREHIERVTIWGVSDKYSWRNDWPVRGRTAAPLLFDRNYEPKPAYHALIHLPDEPNLSSGIDGEALPPLKIK